MADKMKAFVMKRIGEVGFVEKNVPTDPRPNGATIKTTKALAMKSTRRIA